MQCDLTVIPAHRPPAILQHPTPPLDTSAAQAKMRDPCQLCSFMPRTGQPSNGLAQLRHGAGFTDANTVPACACCAHLLNARTVAELVMWVRRVYDHLRLYTLPLMVCGFTFYCQCCGC